MNRYWATVSSVALVAGLLVGVAHTPAQAAGTPKEWFIAQSGTANPNGTSCADPTVVGSDDTAIRTALDAVTADDTITICSGTYTITQTLIVDDSIAIQGQAASTSILDGGNAVQIMRLNDDDTDTTDPSEVFVLVQDLTFRNGNASETGSGCYLTSQCGGAIYVEDESDLTVRRSYFEGNTAGFAGGAIYNHGENNYTGGVLRIEDSTFYRNSADYDGGAVGVVFNANASSHLTVVNSTFVENQVSIRHGGAISESFGDGVITASTFVDNQGPDGDAIRGRFTVTGSLFAGPDTAKMCSSDITVDTTSVSTGPGCGSAVIVTKDSLNLRGLGSWGGPTPTVWIGSGSSAENANGGTCQPLDQRGAARTAPPCDAGAFERQGSADEATTGTLDYPADVQLFSSVLPVSSPSGGGPGRNIGYQSLSTTQCSVNQATGAAIGLTLGECEVRWYLAPTLLLNGAVQDDTLTVSKGTQATLTITSGTGTLAPDDTLTLTTSGGSGSGAVSFSASPASVCSVAGSTLTALDFGTCQVSATKAEDASYLPATSAIVSVQVPAPNPPTPISPPSVPREVTAAWTGSAVTVAWQEPETSGSFPVSNYQVLSQRSGGSCLVQAPALTCDISGLVPGSTYTFTARALSGGGWSPFSAPSNEVTIPRQPEQSIMITGSRTAKRVMIKGQTEGFPTGTELRVWAKVGDAKQFSPGRLVMVEPDGSVTWQRRARQPVQVYLASIDGEQRSNTVQFPPSRRS